MIGPDSADEHSVSGTSSTSSESSSEPTSSASSVGSQAQVSKPPAPGSANDGKEDAQSEGSDDCDEEVRSLDTGALSDLSDDVDMDELWGEDEDRRDLEKAGDWENANLYFSWNSKLLSVCLQSAVRLFGLSMPYEKQLVTLSHES